jgi:protein SCO1/2
MHWLLTFAMLLATPDASVVDQSGRALHFHRDLIAEKTVIVAFFFTRCENVCPMLTHTLTTLQTALGDRLGRDVFIVSVSLDPQYDTPERLAEWARRNGVKTGWTLVTGDTPDVVRAMTGNNARAGLHSPALYIGNGRTGEWVRDTGLASTRHYLEVLERMK